MCGLFGLYLRNKQPLSQNEAEHILRLLAYFSQKRGDDSYGMWSNKGHMIKAPKDIRIDGLDDIKKMAKDLRIAGDWVMGHTRNATHGAINYDNSHPFQMEGLTLAHNGVVTVEGYDDKDHPVDSARILKAVVKEGDWAKAMAKVSGSCGLIVTQGDNVFIYQHNQSLNMINLSWATIILSDSTSLRDLAYMIGVPKDKVEVVYPKDQWFWNVNEGGYTLHAPCKSYTYPKSTTASSDYRNPEFFRTHHWDPNLKEYVANDPKEAEKEKKEFEEASKQWEGKYLAVPPFTAKSTYMTWAQGMRVIESLYNASSMRAMYNIIKGFNWYQKDWLTLYWLKALEIGTAEPVQGISDWGGKPFERRQASSNTYGAGVYETLNFAMVWDLDDQTFWCIQPEERTELLAVPRKGRKTSCFEFIAAACLSGAWLEFVLYIMIQKWSVVEGPENSDELPVPDGDTVPPSKAPEGPGEKEEEETVTLVNGEVVVPIGNVSVKSTQPLPVRLTKKGSDPIPLVPKKEDTTPSEVK
jgi:hypothetical protein